MIIPIIPEVYQKQKLQLFIHYLYLLPILISFLLFLQYFSPITLILNQKISIVRQLNKKLKI